ncbi:MAG: hypothetical protein P4L51_07355 [Puia sp.]|nr:hypothetical protein [Puia sp.]
MQTLTLTGTDLFLGWLADSDQELYSLFRKQMSVETYDGQESCVLHLFVENEDFSDKDRTALSNRWKEYCELFNVPVNKESLKDLSGTPLKEIFNKYSGQLVKFIFTDDRSFFGRFQQLYYWHSPTNPAPPTETICVDLIKYPNFYSDQNPTSGATEAVVVFQGQIKHVVPVKL